MFPWCSLFLKVPRGLNAFSDVKFLLCERKAGKAGTADCYEAKKTYIVDDAKWRHKVPQKMCLNQRNLSFFLRFRWFTHNFWCFDAQTLPSYSDGGIRLNGYGSRGAAIRYWGFFPLNFRETLPPNRDNLFETPRNRPIFALLLRNKCLTLKNRRFEYEDD